MQARIHITLNPLSWDLESLNNSFIILPFNLIKSILKKKGEELKHLCLIFSEIRLSMISRNWLRSFRSQFPKEVWIFLLCEIIHKRSWEFEFASKYPVWFSIELTPFSSLSLSEEPFIPFFFGLPRKDFTQYVYFKVLPIFDSERSILVSLISINLRDPLTWASWISLHFLWRS